MTTYLSRSAWTSTSASGVGLSGGELVGVAVHWPGTSQASIGAASRSSIANRLRSYRSFHVNSRGWRDIGYNLAIDQAGRVWMLRSTQWHGNLVGAHAASGGNPRANHKYVGVLLLLGASEVPSPAMREAFRDWYHTRFLAHWSGRTDVRGHGQVHGAQTSCPGSRARAAIDDMTRKPSGGGSSGDDDMTPEQADMLKDLHVALVNGNRAQVTNPRTDGDVSVRYGVQESWETVEQMFHVLANGNSQQVIHPGGSGQSSVRHGVQRVWAGVEAVKVMLAEHLEGAAGDTGDLLERIEQRAEAGAAAGITSALPQLVSGVLDELGDIDVSQDSIVAALERVLREGVGNSDD